jgi:hypothetical protein
MRISAHAAAAMVTIALAMPPAQRPGTPGVGQPTGPLPAGWKSRLDTESMKVAPGAVKEEKNALIFSTGPAAGIYWKDGMKAEKDFVMRASFSQLKTSEHAEAYGLFIDGQDLDKATQRYIYFLIRQDGKFSIRSRNGAATRAIVDWKAAPAMMEPKGVKTSNTLQITAAGTDVSFLVNDKPVHRMTRPPASDGIAGLRINHNLDVQVSQLELKKP